jgi:hypothetical protein
MAQTAPPTEQREEGSRQRRGSKFERLTGITDAQKTQLRQIHELAINRLMLFLQPLKKPKSKQFARIPKLR